MIIVAWEKRKVLNAMATTCLKDDTGIYLIMYEKWDFLKIYVDKILAFREATKLFCKSRPLYCLILLLVLKFC